MAIDSESKRWAMHAFASGIGRNTAFNPDTSGLVAIERATVLRHCGTVPFGQPVITVSTVENMVISAINQRDILILPDPDDIVIVPARDKETIIV